MKAGRPEFWTAFFTGVLAGFTAALAGATIYALIFAKAQIEEAHKEAQVEHLLALVKQYDDEPMVTYRKRLAEQKLKGEEESDDLYNVLDFFETVGRLVDRGYLDESDVYDDFGYPVLMLNADVGKIIQDYQREDPVAYVGLTSLIKKMGLMETENKGALQHISTNDISEFYRAEMSVGVGAPIKVPRHAPAHRAK